MSMTREQLAAKRDHKVGAAMAEWAPIWKVNEEYRPREEALLFNLVFQHPHHGWLSERYKYDGFNDVLYHLGQRRLSEDEALKFQAEEPYLPGEVTIRVPNAPQGRPTIAGR